MGRLSKAKKRLKKANAVLQLKRKFGDQYKHFIHNTGQRSAKILFSQNGSLE